MAFQYNRAAPWEIDPDTGQWFQAESSDEGYLTRRTADGGNWAQVDLSTPENQAALGRRLTELLGYDPNNRQVNQNGSRRVQIFNPVTGGYEDAVATASGHEMPLSLAQQRGEQILQYLSDPVPQNQLKEFGGDVAKIASAFAAAYGAGSGLNSLLSGAGGAGGGATGLEWLSGADPMGAPLSMPAGVSSSGGFLGGIQNALSSIPNPFGVGASGSTKMADGLWDTVKSLAGPASNIIGGLLGANAASDAADAQIRAGQDSNALQLAMFNQNRADQEPWRQAGVGALNQLSAGIQPGGSLVKPFSMDDYQADPGYNFRLSEGLKAVERSAAARGNLLSGGALKGITRYGQDMASNEYQNAYNRYNQDQANQYNRLAGVAGTGQTAVQQLGQAGQNYANQAGNTLQGIGNARASGYVGSANALSGGLAGAYNTYQSGQFLNSLMNRPSYGGMTVVGGSPSFGGAFQDDY